MSDVLIGCVSNFAGHISNLQEFKTETYVEDIVNISNPREEVLWLTGGLLKYWGEYQTQALVRNSGSEAIRLLGVQPSVIHMELRQ